MKAIISNYAEENKIIIENIFVPVGLRGKGLAREAMIEFLGKNKGVAVELHAYPQEDGIDVFRLVEFYESLGFEVVCGSESVGFEMVKN